MLVTELSLCHHVYPSPVYIYAVHDGHAFPVYLANISMMAFPIYAIIYAMNIQINIYSAAWYFERLRAAQAPNFPYNTLQYYKSRII
jgi:hypothetical protein